MKAFLRRFGGLVLGILSGFDRLVFRGKLCPLYAPEGMNCYLSANHVLRRDFEEHAQQVTRQVPQASLVEHAKSVDRFRYLASANINKDEVARAFAAKHRVAEGLVCVLQCVEPCWSYELQTRVVEGAKLLTVQGKQRKCSHLYHYFIDPRFGWMYVRLQTWFPFEVQVYTNGREWLSRRMDKEKLHYRRSDNKILWVEDWQRAQQLFDEQLQTNWPTVLDAWRQQVHPLHPRFYEGLRIKHWANSNLMRSTMPRFRSLLTRSPPDADILGTHMDNGTDDLYHRQFADHKKILGESIKNHVSYNYPIYIANRSPRPQKIEHADPRFPYLTSRKPSPVRQSPCFSGLPVSANIARRILT